MRPVLLMIAAMIIACYPRMAFSQAVINGNTSVSVYDVVPVDNVSTINHTYSMDGFVNNEEYKIVAVQDPPYLAQNLQMYAGNVTIGSDVQFTFQSNSQFEISFYFSLGTAPNQLQTLKFQIYRKRLGIWDWQSSFFLDLNTICRGDYSLAPGSGYPLYLQKYEVAGNLSVTNYAYPNGILMLLDGGQSVSLLPGFYTTLANGGAVLVLNDGCGGAYRMANAPESDIKGMQGSAVAKNEISAYPNPATDKCHIHYPKELQGKTLNVVVMDIKGQILYNHQEIVDTDTEIDLNKFETGMYFISISGEGLNYNQKLIKQ